jgi:hypothetical protein
MKRLLAENMANAVGMVDTAVAIGKQIILPVSNS